MHVKYPAYGRQARKKPASTLSQVLRLFPGLAEQNVHRTLQIAREGYVLENGRITPHGDRGPIYWAIHTSRKPTSGSDKPDLAAKA